MSATGNATWVSPRSSARASATMARDTRTGGRVQHAHHYSATCAWSGSTAGGYESYDRTHRATAPPATAELTLASDPAFRGDPALLNPEQLLVLAASSCQL